MTEFSLYFPGVLLAYSAFVLSIITPGLNSVAIMGTSMSVWRGGCTGGCHRILLLGAFYAVVGIKMLTRHT